MDAPPPRRSEAGVLERAAAALSAHLGVEATIRSEPASAPDRPDAILELPLPGLKRHYTVDVKSGLRPANLGAIVQQLRLDGAENKLLVADYVSPPLGERLRQLGVFYADAVGNAWIQDPPIMLWVSGRKRERGMVRGGREKAFEAAGLRLVFALLCHPEWCSRPYRELATRAGVAHGTVGAVLKELASNRHLIEILGKKRLAQPRALLLRWAEAYPRALRPRLVIGRYEPANDSSLALMNPADFGFQWGGEMAASLLTNYLRPATWTLYGSAPTSEALAAWRLRPSANGRVEVLERFWSFPSTEDQQLVPLPLIYADLLIPGDGRSFETAQMILERMDAGSLPS